MTDTTTKFRSCAILGCTGSVGTQAADVAEKLNIPVRALCAGSDFSAVEAMARKFSPAACAMADERAASELKARLADTNIKVYSGTDGICEMVEASDAESVVNSITGEAGLLPTLATIRSGKELALANKESLVVAGDIVMAEARKMKTEIRPVDSEHCAIYQCLRAGRHSEDDVKKILLTASGGPFFGKSREELSGITPEMALAHPTWKMGPKITIDSATLMNKGFEVIEAVHLFGVPVENVEVVVHRESIIHSMVEYIDNSVIAQLSVPDMRSCVQYALSSPARTEAVIDELDLFSVAKLTFARPDTDTFVLLDAARRAVKAGGAMGAVLNAANEIAVGAFLDGRIGFTDISDSVLEVMSALEGKRSCVTLEDILAADAEARELCRETVSRISKKR